MKDELGAFLKLGERDRSIFDAAHTEKRRSQQEPGSLILVFGSLADQMSTELARRSGGTIVDLETLSELAEEDPTEDGEAFLAMQQAGGLPTMKVVLPLLLQARAARTGPFFLNGYPRVASQLKKLEDVAGRLSIGILAGVANGSSDAQLATHMERTGTALHEVSSCEKADVDGALAALRVKGIEVP